MKDSWREEVLQVLGAPVLVLTAYGLDFWRLSPAVQLPRELLQPTAASILGSVLPQIILVAAALLVGWYLLVRSRPSVRVSLFYCLTGAYLLSYMPLLQLAYPKGGIRELWEVLYFPCARYLLFLPLQILLQLSFAVLFVLGLAGMFRWFASQRVNDA